MPNALLEEYIHRFWGYGAWTRKTWFLGIEEGILGGHPGPEDLQHRLDIWLARGCRELEDAPEFCRKLGHSRYFPPPPQTPMRQPTWDPLSIIYLALRNQPTAVPDVHDFRRAHFGQGANDFAAIEVFPLPAKKTGVWHYQTLAHQLHFLINRTVYHHSVYAGRTKSLRRKIAIYHPTVLLCYGLTLKEHFEGIVGHSFTPLHLPLKIHHAFIPVSNTHAFMVEHMTPRGRNVPRDTFERIGLYIRNWLAASLTPEELANL